MKEDTDTDNDSLNSDSSDDQVTDAAFRGLTLSFCGKHPWIKEKITSKIEKYGGEYSENVTKKCSYLISNENLLRSKKCQQAIQLDIPILSFDFIVHSIKEKRGLSFAETKQFYLHPKLEESDYEDWNDGVKPKRDSSTPEKEKEFSDYEDWKDGVTYDRS